MSPIDDSLRVPRILVGTYDRVTLALDAAAEEHARIFHQTGAWPMLTDLVEARLTLSQSDRLRSLLATADSRTADARLGQFGNYVTAGRRAYAALTGRPKNADLIAPPYEWRQELVRSEWGAVCYVASEASLPIGLETATILWRTLAEILRNRPRLVLHTSPRGHVEEFAQSTSRTVLWSPVLHFGIQKDLPSLLTQLAEWAATATQQEVFALAAAAAHSVLSEETSDPVGAASLGRSGLLQAAVQITVEDLERGFARLDEQDRRSVAALDRIGVMRGAVSVLRRFERASRARANRP